MQPPSPPVPTPLALLDTTGGLARRKRTSLWFVGSLLLVSILILTVGLAATTRTENVTVGGYYPGIILGFGSFLGIIGIHLVENRRQMLVAAIVFISFGVVAAFCCAVVDSVFAARHMELRPLNMGRCQFYSSRTGYLYDIYQTEVTCHSLTGRCQLKVRSNTCYCCDLYTCNRLCLQGILVPLGDSRAREEEASWGSAWLLGAFYFRTREGTILGSGHGAVFVVTLRAHIKLSSDLSLPEDARPLPQCRSSLGCHPSAPALCAPACFLPGEKPPPYAP
ncbi:Protein FAM70B [Heterocephalus glaber]|uniref:Protein FAM70B n=1 Tax=Heterocephalus glaber TaxID=10181 RepID=G5AVU9_HETGA|nr:Protein FAM70B [Heterocephalus glaber]